MHNEAAVNGIRLHYVEAGEGPLVILIHGFPEFWYSWHHQIPALAEAGFRVIAPDMRGYNLSEKPPGVKSYREETLADDIAGLVEMTGADQATIVGHDWGGAVAWSVAGLRPEVVTKLVVMNAPHPLALRRELRSPSQLLKSWYFFFFQLPWLPEAVFRMRDFAVLERTLRQGPVRPETFSDDDIQRYKDAMARPGALTATINYYRAALRRNPFRVGESASKITTPTLLIWGEQDSYLGLGLTEALDDWVPGIRVERIADASHWVQLDAPEKVNQLMLDFLGEPSG